MWIRATTAQASGTAARAPAAPNMAGSATPAPVGNRRPALRPRSVRSLRLRQMRNTRTSSRPRRQSSTSSQNIESSFSDSQATDARAWLGQNRMPQESTSATLAQGDRNDGRFRRHHQQQRLQPSKRSLIRECSAKVLLKMLFSTIRCRRRRLTRSRPHQICSKSKQSSSL
ncbi:hypothetical protein BC831DRAFT_459674 [Entophlyctis helioformis]|nr:hypothetical protein BC831DRAFT_459674 [Entophlyctis helioformis]